MTDRISEIEELGRAAEAGQLGKAEAADRLKEITGGLTDAGAEDMLANWRDVRKWYDTRNWSGDDS